MGHREPEVIRDKETMRRWSKGVRSQEKTIGLVRPSFHRRSHQARALPSYVSDVIVVFNPRNLYNYDGGRKNTNGGGGGGDGKKTNGSGGGGGKKTNGSGGGGGKVVSCVEESGLAHETCVCVGRAGLSSLEVLLPDVAVFR